jgi:hypothetical protein
MGTIKNACRFVYWFTHPPSMDSLRGVAMDLGVILGAVVLMFGASMVAIRCGF